MYKFLKLYFFRLYLLPWRDKLDKIPEEDPGMPQDQDQKVVDRVKTGQHTDVLQVHLVPTKKLKLALVLLNWTLSVYFIIIFINFLEYCKLVINFKYLCYLERTWCIWWIWPWKSSTSINVIIFIMYNYIIKKKCK